MQIILAPTDSDFLDQLIPVLKDAAVSNRTASLAQSLAQYAQEREGDIERIGLTKHEEFLGSVNQLQKVREGTVVLTSEILDLNQDIQTSTEKLAEQKQALVNTRGVQQNIKDVSNALKESLDILRALNNAHELIRKKKYYAALKSLDDLQNEHLVPIIQNKYATQYKLADLIQKSIPDSQKTISKAVMNDLNTWLYRIRETSQFLGEVAFFHTKERQTRQRERIENSTFLGNFKLNSSIEMVFDENNDFDVIDNDEVQVDFTPLHEALHIHEALGQLDRFRADYAATRRQQKELLLPGSVDLLIDDQDASLRSLLEGIAGFAVIERATMQRAPQLRSSIDVRIPPAPFRRLPTLTVTGGRALGLHVPGSHISHHQRFARCDKRRGVAQDQANRGSVYPDDGGRQPALTYCDKSLTELQSWGYSISMMNSLQLTLFHKYAELLKRRFSEDFQEVIAPCFCSHGIC